MSSIDLINSSMLKHEVPTCVVYAVIVPVTLPVTTSAVTKGIFGARAVPSVEGIALETIGITFGG